MTTQRVEWAYFHTMHAPRRAFPPPESLHTLYSSTQAAKGIVSRGESSERQRKSFLQCALIEHRGGVPIFGFIPRGKNPFSRARRALAPNTRTEHLVDFKDHRPTGFRAARKRSKVYPSPPALSRSSLSRLDFAPGERRSKAVSYPRVGGCRRRCCNRGTSARSP